MGYGSNAVMSASDRPSSPSTVGAAVGGLSEIAEMVGVLEKRLGEARSRLADSLTGPKPEKSHDAVEPLRSGVFTGDSILGLIDRIKVMLVSAADSVGRIETML